MKNRSLRLLQAFIFALSTVVIPAELTWGQQVPGYPGLPSPTGQPIEQNFNLGFGDDDRVPLYSSASPWRAIGRVQTNGGGHCTGSLIGENLVLTNAHCIFNNNGQLVGANFAPNYKQGSAPETVRGIEYWWGTSNPNNERRYDWAIIKLERPIGKQYGWFGWRSLNYNQLRNRKVIFAGYSTFRNERVPAFVNGQTAQVHIGCTVRDINPNSGWINTDCDNGRGGSGGPVFIVENGNAYIVAINAAEYREGDDAQSYFTRDYTPGFGNIAVPTATFAHALSPPSGYYRLSNRPEVYFVNTNNRTYCHVQSPIQMNLYGGFQQVRVVRDNGYRTGIQSSGECSWPDRFYRRQNKPEVYRLYDNWRTACWVTNPAQMEAFGGWRQVRLVEDSIDLRAGLSAGRNYVGHCQSPR